jgi:hypothetical protein
MPFYSMYMVYCVLHLVFYNSDAQWAHDYYMVQFYRQLLYIRGKSVGHKMLVTFIKL